MKKYLVTISLIVGYYDSEYNPRLRHDEYIVDATSEAEAIQYAKDNLDNTGFSIWESCATEI